MSKPWTYPDNSFDYIHIRYMIGCFKDWVAVYREAYRCLKPGGWIEHMEVSSTIVSDDGSVPEDSIFRDWKQAFVEVGNKMGNIFEIVEDEKYRRWLQEAGFKNVESKLFKTPVGSWPADKTMKEIGQCNLMSLEMGLEGIGLLVLTSVLDWSFEEVQVFLAKVRAGLKNKSYHGYCLW